MIWPAGGQNSIPSAGYRLSGDESSVISPAAWQSRATDSTGSATSPSGFPTPPVYSPGSSSGSSLTVITARAFEKYDVLVGRLGELNELKRLLHPGMQASHERHDVYRHIRPFGYLSQVL